MINNSSMNKTIFTVMVTVVICAAVMYFLKEKQIKGLKAEKIELINDVNLKDSITNNLESLFYDIENNLRLIKERRNQIIISDNESPIGSKEALLNDITMLNELLEDNERKVEGLEKLLKQSGLEIKNFRNRIELLNENIASQNKEIVKLKDIIRGKDYEMVELNKKIDELDRNIISQIDTILRKQNIIEEQALALNSGYYIVGTRKELKEKALLEGSGFLKLKKTQNVDTLDEGIFTKVDINAIKSIPLYAKKVKVHSDHPSDSYVINTEDGKITFLEITNPKEFWKISKYVLIEIK